MINTKYEHWLNFEGMDLTLKAELEKMSESEIQDAFYRNLEFGTAGMRGILGAGSNRLNIYTIRKANVGFAKYLLENPECAKKGVAIAYDNRHYSYEFALESAKVLATFDIPSYVFTTLRPTPELSFAVRHLKCAGGIVVTASHNPKEYNGYKIYDETGCQLVPHLMDKVINYVSEIADELLLTCDLSEHQKTLIHMIDEEVDVPYKAAVETIVLNKDVKKDNFKVVFTPQHGTARVLGEKVLKDAGYNVILVEEQADPNPDFINTITPNPEEKDAYNKAIEYMIKYDADIAISTDPDADRVGVVVKHQGEYILMSGNQTGSVLLEYVFSQMRALNKMPVNPVMFNTVVTSDLGEKVAHKYDVDVEKTLTGFKFIGNKIHQHELLKDKNFVFGYEESYGYLIKDIVRDKDAIQACLIISECAAYYKTLNKTLMDVLHDLYKEFGWYEESQVALTLKGSAGADEIVRITSTLRNNPPREIGGSKVIRIEDYKNAIASENGQKEILDYPSSDVLKFFLDDGSWIAIRPSGTEPKCKFYYCIKGSDEKKTKAKTKIYQDAMSQLIK